MSHGSTTGARTTTQSVDIQQNTASYVLIPTISMGVKK